MLLGGFPPFPWRIHRADKSTSPPTDKRRSQHLGLGPGPREWRPCRWALSTREQQSQGSNIPKGPAAQDSLFTLGLVFWSEMLGTKSTIPESRQWPESTEKGVGAPGVCSAHRLLGNECQDGPLPPAHWQCGLKLETRPWARQVKED